MSMTEAIIFQCGLLMRGEVMQKAVIKLTNVEVNAKIGILNNYFTL